MVSLNLGCGGDYLEGYVNVDIDRNIKKDLWCDVNECIPYPDESVDMVRAFDLLEHLDVSGINEIYRVLKKGGRLYARVPYFSCRNAYSDFTHVRFFNSITFRNSIFKRFTLERQEVFFSLSDHWISFVIPEGVLNVWERLVPGLFPPSHIIVRLKK